ncbi:hypothetical protein C1645_817698 [Glomus cerebriforme]|uniref:DNA polymerase delta catalytic subunit n=1 Tax=Glomus cerebriforme TaxID=658196 RepID=A0A397TE85_9GLOM|nr:hypothetical protein C1645_817698 [Glomus cerebriforme]
MCTASDDLNCQYYYRKVARKERLSLSSWTILSNYLYEHIQKGTYLFQVSVNNYNPISEDDSLGLGKFPTAQSDESNVFMICMSVHWKDDPKPLKQICFVNVETTPDPRWTTIICGSQINLLKAFALYWKLLAPDIQVGFNDSQYDWRFIMKKAKKLGVLEWMFNQMSLKPLSFEKITKWQYQYNKIKVNDMLFHSKHLKISGYIAIDICLCFMKLYSKAEKSSLAFYLNKCELESKMDMSFHRMFKYYKNTLKEADVTTAEQMRKIAKYCIIDALSCQRLMIKRNVINEYREVVSIAFLSLFDAHYFAEEMKVCNLLDANAWQNGILISTISIEQTKTRKYPGAYVFPPIKGLKNRRSVTGLDFASLYPNLIITYNLLPDKIILSKKQALFIKCSGKKLHKIEFLFNAKKEDMKLVVNSLGLGESLSLSEAIKQVLANVKEEKCTGFTKNLYHFINQKKHEFMAKYDSVCFDCSCLDAKQYTFKVYMNTFYGTAGDSNSPFFLRELAEGVTSAGQKNIKFVVDFVKNKRFGIKYGDTDSLYFACPEESFQECDEAYNNDRILKEEYWSRMVEISMEEIEKLHDGVNEFLRKDNRSSYLKMVYEEVLFSVVFTEKKKYYDILHERKCIMEKSMRVNNICTLHQIVENVIKETINDISQKDLNEMIKAAVWRPDKNNKSLTPEPYEIPKLGEWFEYVVVENDSSERMGDKMEYPEVPSSEIVLEALKKLKDGNKAGNNKADDGGVDEDDMNEVNEDEMDKDEVSKIRDVLAQKSAEKWIRGYIKNLRDSLKKDKTIISHLWKEAGIYAKSLFDTAFTNREVKCSKNDAYYTSILNVLDKKEESIRLKLATLLTEISKKDVGFREGMYKFVTKSVDL